MNILAPASTFESVKLMVEAGANEIYLGADEGIYNSYSFTGRGKKSPGNETILRDFGEIKEIVDYSHENKVYVNFLGNTPFFYDGIYQGDHFEKQYINYVEKGIAAGVDSLVIGDVGLLNAVSKRKYGIELHASLYMKTLNDAQVDFLKTLNVNRITLPYHITMNEIEEFCKRKDMNFEVVGYLGCSFFNGACGFLHAYGEGVTGGFAPGVSCKNIYQIENGEDSFEGSIFDCEAACAFCTIKKLDEVGVTALKIVGRDRNTQGVAEVIKMFSQGLKEDADVQPLDWWKRFYCKKRTNCKYNNVNPNYKYMIGVI